MQAEIYGIIGVVAGWALTSLTSLATRWNANRQGLSRLLFQVLVAERDFRVFRSTCAGVKKISPDDESFETIRAALLDRHVLTGHVTVATISEALAEYQKIRPVEALKVSSWLHGVEKAKITRLTEFSKSNGHYESQLAVLDLNIDTVISDAGDIAHSLALAIGPVTWIKLQRSRCKKASADPITIARLRELYADATAHGAEVLRSNSEPRSGASG